MDQNALDGLMRDATLELEDVYGEAPVDEVDAMMARTIASFQQAAVEDRIPEGYLFDANSARRRITFDLVFQKLVDDLLNGLPNGAILRHDDVVYRVGFPMDVDAVDAPNRRSLLRGKNAVLGAEGGRLYDPGGRFYWATTSQQIELVGDREWFVAAKEQLLAQRNSPERDGLG